MRLLPKSIHRCRRYPTKFNSGRDIPFAGVLGATRYGEVLPVAAALIISLVASLIIALYLPESRPCSPEDLPERTDVSKVFGQEQRECYNGSGASTRARDVLALSSVPFLLLTYFFIFLGFNLFYTAFPVHAVRGLGGRSLRSAGSSPFSD